VSDPLKEGHHFDQSLGGIAGLFENIRSNTHVSRALAIATLVLNDTQGIANSHLETEKALKGSVLPILERLHAEIKNKDKELSKGALKGAKNVESVRNETQKYIEMLGQHTAAFSSSGGKPESSEDPYVIQRRVNHRLNKQVLEENNSREDLLAVQNSFQQFEGHVIQTIQQAMSAFLQYVGGQAERQKAMYADMVSTAQRIPPDFEFKGLVKRNGGLLVDPSTSKRTVSNISFPNQDHSATKPLIAGLLERKTKGLGSIKGFNTGYYAVTPSKYLHEFQDDDDYRKDPTPEMSLYLPNCIIGAVNGDLFNIKGKDVSKGKVGSALATSHEFTFKARSPAEAKSWWEVIREAVGADNVTDHMASSSSPSSPVESRNVSGQHPPQYTERNVAPVQTQGLPQGQGQPSAGAVSHSAGGLHSTGAGVSPATGAPAGTSGLEKAPGQY